MTQNKVFCLLFILICCVVYFSLEKEWRRIEREHILQRFAYLAESMANFTSSLNALGISAKFASQKIKEFGDVFNKSISKE